MEKNINIEVFQATRNDLETVTDLFDKYRVFYKQPSNVEQSRDFLKERFEKEDSVIFIAVFKDENGKRTGAGFVQLYPSFSSVSMQRLWILNDLYVDSKYRKNGLAKALMEKAKDYSVKTKAKELVLQTAINNYPAQSLYESIGYKKTEDVYEYTFSLKQEYSQNK